VGIKEAGGDVDRVTQIRHACGDKFMILSGDDGLTLPFLAAGARGVISVVSNLYPDLMVDLQKAWDDGCVDDAQRLHLRVFELAGAMFIESSPVPVKTALALQRRMNAKVRSPLVPLSEEGLGYLKKILSSSIAA
jgi:4-hydroxy-tetrahydrodipicolinate synthase